MIRARQIIMLSKFHLDFGHDKLHLSVIPSQVVSVCVCVRERERESERERERERKREEKFRL